MTIDGQEETLQSPVPAPGKPLALHRRLYRGETKIDFIGHRRRWYFASMILMVIFVLSFFFRGFNYGVEFVGGSQFQVPVSGLSITTGQVNDAFTAAGTPAADPPQEVGSGSSRQIVVKTAAVDATASSRVKNAVAQRLKINPDTITDTTVSSSWGHDVTMKALEGLIVFLIAVTIYISLRFEWRMAVGGVAGLFHDLIVAAGVYSLVGFQVTPSTIVGLLTILGFSLYDTVVVFDKVAENAKDILAGSRLTFTEAANTAVNQTLMRSINTSLIALLPVAGLLFVGVGVLGVGTIEDLALILFVGLASGAYSSLFLCTPMVVELTESQPEYKKLTKRVMAKRASEARRLAEATGGDADQLSAAIAQNQVAAAARRRVPAPAPKPGAKPQRGQRK